MLTWGDPIRIRATAPVEYRPGELAEIVGIWTIKTIEQANSFGQPIGTFLYTVEYGDGSDRDVPGEYIDKINKDENS